ncbi:DUF882 domain-containing protein [Sulfitobacter sp. R18_1]|uniref:YcbK family protein n=1 Tax=Sulfitobacter sp. R18_1 TaxID=2821104 RepID=UPI001ADBEA76|nr:DUF882 domain-containing protein [Sulfitobacter sp. R18_1]MBO9428390.1 YcbK family protein [Sulfitobacter sp. R18_1]
MDRRRFLSRAAALSVAGAMASPIPAMAGVNDPATNKSIRLMNANNGERLTATFWRGDWFDAGAIEEINHFMRDWRKNEVIDFDPYLVGILHNVCLDTRYGKEVIVLSGYRTKSTNDWLRRDPRYNASKNSLHMFGRAVDFTLPQRPLKDVRNAARRFQVGGLGYYPTQNFIHIDTGEQRYWTS